VRNSNGLPLFAGQRMDVFIEDSDRIIGVTMK